MMWFIFFNLFFIFSVKEFYFYNFSFKICTDSMFMCSIIPLTLIMMFFFIFFVLEKKNSNLVNNIFFILVMSVNMTFLVSDSFLFLVFLELTVIPMSFLILYLSKDLDKLSSILFMMFINLFGSIPFMVFVLMNVLNYFSLESALNFCLGTNSNFFLWSSFIMMLISKLPVLFLHFWLTKAHVSASGYCSMILASIMLKLGSFGMFKFSSTFLKVSSFYSSSMVSLGCCSTLFFSVIMTRFLDVKNLVACSSVLHMAMMTPLILTGSSVGMFSSLLMMVGHGLISYFLFFLVTLIYEATLNRTSDFNKSMESIFKIFTLILFVFLFMNLGVPPIISFISEVLFLYFLSSFSFYSCLVFIISMLIAIFFVLLLLTKVLFGKKFILTQIELENSLVPFSFLFAMSVILILNLT